MQIGVAGIYRYNRTTMCVNVYIERRDAHATKTGPSATIIYIHIYQHDKSLSVDGV